MLNFLPVKNFKEVSAGQDAFHTNFGVHKPKKEVSLEIKLQCKKSNVSIMEC